MSASHTKTAPTAVETTLGERLDALLELLTPDERKKAPAELKKALRRAEIRREVEAKRAAEAAAKEYGFSLADLVGDSTSSKKAKSPSKYQNPADKSQTWTGRGRKPRWVIDAIAKGKSLDDMKIGKAA